MRAEVIKNTQTSKEIKYLDHTNVDRRQEQCEQSVINNNRINGTMKILRKTNEKGNTVKQFHNVASKPTHFVVYTADGRQDEAAELRFP
jgi:hypothetical protein